jgi:formamidopyrimidine-DNA glycosylase
MPELPEVETVRRDLDSVLHGRTIDNVVLGRLRSVRRHLEPEEFRIGLMGTKVVGTRRQGKYLLVDLERGADVGDHDRSGEQSVLIVHLRMSGQLLHSKSTSEPLRPHTHVRLQLDDQTEVRFVDPRTFGEMFVTSSDCPELAHVGPDALDPEVTPSHMSSAAKGRTVGLKPFLLDQSVVAGVGSIYADEICFRAGLRPGRSVARITKPQFVRVHTEMVGVLQAAIEARGSTLGDGQYVGMDGQPGTFASQHQVHARAGAGCYSCGSIIARAVIAQRSAHWCPTCQK